MNNKRKNIEGESSDSKKQKTELTKKEKMVKILDYAIFDHKYGNYDPYDVDAEWWADGQISGCNDISLEDMKEFIKQNRQERIYIVLSASFSKIKVSAIVVDDKVYYQSLRLEYPEKIYFPVPTHGAILKIWIDKTLKALYDPNIFLLAQNQEKNKNLFTMTSKGTYLLEMEPLSKYINPGVSIYELILQARKFVWNQAEKKEVKEEKIF